MTISPSKYLRFGTRSSPMARLVADQARDLILAAHPEMTVDIFPYSSQGDKFQGDLRKLGGKGAFIKDLEDRLLKQEIDVAIHALKDIPGDIPMHEDLDLVCFFAREDARDALVLSKEIKLDDIKDGSGLTLATSSPRRQAALRRLYPQSTIIPLRGNVDTRLRKMQEGQFDGMVLSYAGLQRLKLDQHVSHVYAPTDMLPAIGQGVLCLQMRKEDIARCPYLARLNHHQTHTQIAAERAMLGKLQGNCYSAIAGYASLDKGAITLKGCVFHPEKFDMIDVTETATLPDGASPQEHLQTAKRLGDQVATQLFERGAREFIDALAA